MAPETFYPFYSLPLELRLKIWTLALPARTIRFKLSKAHLSEIPDHREPLPSPFHVCQQSRVEMNILYHPLTSTVFKTAPGELVNPNIDTIFCDDVIFCWITHARAAVLDNGDINRWKDATTEEYYAKHSALSLLALDQHFASSVTSLVLSAAGLKAIETGPGIDPLEEMKANNRMSKNMMSALRSFPALRELKILLDQKIDFQLPVTEMNVEEKLRPVSLCYLSNRCHDCCKVMPGLEWVDDWTWRVKSKNGERWRGPAISFVCFGRFPSNCWDKGHPGDCVHCIWDRQLGNLPGGGLPPPEWQGMLDLLEL